MDVFMQSLKVCWLYVERAFAPNTLINNSFTRFYFFCLIYFILIYRLRFFLLLNRFFYLFLSFLVLPNMRIENIHQVCLMS